MRAGERLPAIKKPLWAKAEAERGLAFKAMSCRRVVALGIVPINRMGNEDGVSRLSYGRGRVQHYS